MSKEGAECGMWKLSRSVLDCVSLQRRIDSRINPQAGNDIVATKAIILGFDMLDTLQPAKIVVPEYI